MSALLRQVSYHPVKDFEPILQYSVYQYGLVVRADSPWKTFKDFIAYAKANPGKIKYSTAGAGTPQHLVMMQLGDLAKTKWTHIPFESGAKAITALLGGHVDSGFSLERSASTPDRNHPVYIRDEHAHGWRGFGSGGHGHVRHW